MSTFRQCTKCGEEKALSEFAPDRRVSDGCQARCRSCQRGRIQPPQPRAYYSARRLGISVEEWQAIYDSQNGRCAICEDEHPKLGLDHDHVTEIVRAFLCPKCNIALGMSGDSPERLRALADYIERHRALAELKQAMV